MKYRALLACAVALAAIPALPARAASSAVDVATLVELAKAHEQVFKSMKADHVAAVLQKGEKQFTVYGVVSVRAVGPLLEISVKNGEKYSVSAADVFFISNNGFKL